MASKLTLQTVFSAVDKMTGPVKTMQGRMSGFTKSMQTGLGLTSRATSALGGAIRTLLPALTAAGAARALTAFATKADEIAKSARMFGMTTDALQELRYASGLMGVETGTLDTAFKQLNNNLGQLKVGQGSLYQRLTLTNPALARQLRTVENTDEAFMMLMESIEAETDATRRAALAQAAFGKSGQELIKMADAGTDGIAALRAEAHKYGIVISADATASSEAFNDSMSRLKQSAMALANQGLTAVIQKLQPMIQGAADWVAANKEMLSMKLDKTFEAIGSAMGIVAKLWDAGIIPGILGGVLAFKSLNAVLAITNALSMANPILAIVTAVAALIGLIVANWDKIDGFFKNLAGKGTSGSNRNKLDNEGAFAPVSPNVAGIESHAYSENRSTVDINVGGLPSGSTVAQTGRAPGVTLNTGRTIGGSK
jgi:hypothetical protein